MASWEVEYLQLQENQENIFTLEGRQTIRSRISTAARDPGKIYLP